MVKTTTWVFFGMLLGQFICKVASKNRIAVPKKFREELGDKLIVSQGYERSLLLLSPKKWQELITGAATGPFTTGAIRDTLRFLVGGAMEVELDEQGRFILPQNLKAHADIGNEVAFVGLMMWVEIWDAKRWGAYSTKIARQSSVVAERLKKLKN